MIHITVLLVLRQVIVRRLLVLFTLSRSQPVVARKAGHSLGVDYREWHLLRNAFTIVNKGCLGHSSIFKNIVLVTRYSQSSILPGCVIHNAQLLRPSLANLISKQNFLGTS